MELGSPVQEVNWSPVPLSEEEDPPGLPGPRELDHALGSHNIPIFLAAL